jgi:flagellar assembly protein FliH
LLEQIPEHPPMSLPESLRLIKAHRMRLHATNATFNIEDVRQQCVEYVAQAKGRGEEIVAQAASEAAEIRRIAFEEGRIAGEQAGFAAARGLIEARAQELAVEMTRSRLASVLPALDRTIETLEIEREKWLAEWEAAAVRLSAVMAEKLVRQELSQRPELTVEIIREALQLAAGSPQITLRLHPLDLAMLTEHGTEIIERFSRLGEMTLTPEESVSRGGCLIETRQGSIDARIETKLARIVDELLGGEEWKR